VGNLRHAWADESSINARTVALALPGGIAAAIVWLAALTDGQRLIPYAPETSSDERLRLGSSQRPDVIVVAQPEEAAGFARPNARVYTANELYTLARHATSPVAQKTPRPPTRTGTLRLTTSGTTGDPKGVMLSARQIAWTADQVRMSHRLTPEDRGLCVLPFFHINAPVVSLCATLLAGACVVIAPRFSVHHFWEWVEREHITWVSIVPTIVALLLTTEKPAFLPGTLRFMRSASAPLPVERHRAFEARFGVPLIETYGLSEAASQITANPLPPAQRKPGSVGLPTGVMLRICELQDATADGLNGDGHASNQRQQSPRDMPAGITGEICVCGPNVITGYDGDASASSFSNGWFRTGDLGYLDDDGYLYITGRLREVINRGGEKIAPREIEELLLTHPTVSDAAVVGEPHPLYGQRVVAYVTTRDAWNEQTEQHVREYCAQRLSAYKVPEAIYCVPALPRNGNGKLNRQALTKPGSPRMTQLIERPAETAIKTTITATPPVDNTRLRMLTHG
jgi:acyl-CoA synthetase (AMP-forming)/AMP-acid ligase II